MNSSMFFTNMVKLPIITTSAKVEDGNLKPILVVYPISQDLLTSLEVESLRIQTLLKYANYDYDLKEHHESSFSPSGSLPCLIVGGKVLAGRDLLSNVPNIDSSLTKVQQSVAFAHIEMTQSKLGMALELSMWYETSYFNEILAKSRGRYYPWPLNYLIPRVERSKKIEAILSRKPVIQVQEIYQSAANALDALSLLLGYNYRNNSRIRSSTSIGTN